MMEPMKVIIIHDTMSIEPIREALAAYNIELEEWISDETPVDITEEPPKNAIFYNRPSASAHDRGHRNSLEQSRVIVRWLHKHDRVVINGLPAIELEDSKSFQYLCAKHNGLPVPKSFTAPVITEEAIRSRFGKDAPFVVKPDRGAKGIDVRIYENLSQFVADKTPRKYPEGLFLVQKYIPTDCGVYRAEFIGGRYIYTTLAREVEQRELPQNARSRCSVPPPSSKLYTIVKDFSHPIIKLFEKLIRNVGVDNAGIEFLFDADGEPWVIDVNSNKITRRSQKRTPGSKVDL